MYIYDNISELLEQEMFQAKVVERIRTDILCWINFSQKLFCLWDNVENYGIAKQATDDSTHGLSQK